MSDINTGTWIRYQADSNTHGKLHKIKLDLRASGKGKYKIEELAAEATKLGLPLLKKIMGV